MNRTSISVVTPSYNQGPFIERTIKSILDQGVPVEYVVFDGGSQDETIDILKKYGEQIKWVSEKDRGQAHAVNKGIAATHGDVIAWINSDDIYYPGALQTVKDYFDQHPEVDLVYGDANHIDLEDQVIEPYPTEDWNLDNLMNVCYICQPAAFFRRRAVERYGMLDEHLHYNMDYDYWLRLGMGGAVTARIPVLLAGSRMYAENKTLKGREKKHYEINDMFIKLCGKVPERWIFNYAHAVLDQRGLPRTARFRFSTLVSMISIWAAIKWNHHVSYNMLVTCRRWITGRLRR